MAKTDFFKQLSKDQQAAINAVLPKEELGSGKQLWKRTDKNGVSVYLSQKGELTKTNNFTYEQMKSWDDVRQQLAFVIVEKEAKEAKATKVKETTPPAEN